VSATTVREQLDALDRGLIETGVAAARDAERLDGRIDELFAVMAEACEASGLAARAEECRVLAGKPAGRHLRLVRGGTP
jgi:hypothetical protein